MEYSNISKELTSKLSKEIKKEYGIYFTPPSCVSKNIDYLHSYIFPNMKVLEPSCGSGEYIIQLSEKYPNIDITGIEYNTSIYESIVSLKKENIHIVQTDFITYAPEIPIIYDLIIGNPPYYVMKKNEVKKEYYPYFEGRPNVFIIFIIKSLQLLREKGILSFILPKSFLNCLYYDKTRKYISTHFQIIQMIDCKDDKYLETQQETIMFIIQKSEKINNIEYIFERNDYTIFADKKNIIRLRELYQNTKSLYELGFKVNVGTVVWNQCKDILTADTTKTLLIYSSDIENNTLNIKTYKNDAKKNYICKTGIVRPMIVINRGYGIGEYKFECCIIDLQTEYLIENHLICIESIESIPREELMEKYQTIMKSFRDKRTLEFIEMYFGNNAINTQELNYILPIY
jgi:tRNA1(Val) A37 N6-methylase TrmN6